MKCLRCDTEMKKVKGVVSIVPDAGWWWCDSCELELETDGELSFYSLDGDIWDDVPAGALLVVKDEVFTVQG